MSSMCSVLFSFQSFITWSFSLLSQLNELFSCRNALIFVCFPKYQTEWIIKDGANVCRHSGFPNTPRASDVGGRHEALH